MRLSRAAGNRVGAVRSGPTDDRTARARIRDAAIDLVAERGLGALSARGVARAAGVSPGLLIHHYGSMDALRAACDEHVVALVRAHKQAAFSAGAQLDVLSLLRDTDAGPLAGYLAAVLAEGSPAVAQLVDELVADAEHYLEQGVASGMLRPCDDPRGRAVVLSLWGLGALVMNDHVKRLLGADLTARGAVSTDVMRAYIEPVTDIYGHGLFSEAFASRTSAALRKDSR